MTLTRLPRLGVGISCEHGRPGIDALALRAAAPHLVHFLEIGSELSRGVDPMMGAWVNAGLPTTWHFLDLNLAEAEDADAEWLAGMKEVAEAVGAAWLCGDAGYWHLGRRERGHQLLLPPIFVPSAAEEMVRAIQRVQAETGMVVLPENPPSTVYVGTMHLLDFYGRVVDRADCGMLVDCAHLAIYQASRGLSPTTGLDAFPLDRVVELHVAGGTHRSHEGFPWIEDDHGPEPLPECWELLHYFVERCPNLKAVIYECEHNTPAAVLPNFERLNRIFPREAP